MAIADRDGVLCDTYWGSGNDNHRLLPVELASAEILFNLADYDELDRFAHGSKGIWETYHPDDRRVVSSQHRLQFRWFVRKGAAPDHATKIANAEQKVTDCRVAVESAQWQLEWAQRDLDALIASVTPSEGAAS